MFFFSRIYILKTPLTLANKRFLTIQKPGSFSYRLKSEPLKFSRFMSLYHKSGYPGYDVGMLFSKVVGFTWILHNIVQFNWSIAILTYVELLMTHFFRYGKTYCQLSP